MHGDGFYQACQHALELAEREALIFIHPYDDPHVIAGQGTIGKEVLEQHRGALDAIFVPVGGGGIAAGVATYVKSIRPEVKVIAVEAEDSACLHAALTAGQRVMLPRVGIFADGVAVAQIGEENFRLAQQYIDEVVLVSTDEICAAIKDIFDDTRAIAEPAGAVALAGLKKYQHSHPQMKHAVAIQSGANMNFDRLRHVSERAEVGEFGEGLFGVRIPERPGSFRKLCQALGPRSVTEFNYRYADSEYAQVFIGVEFNGDEADHMAFLANLETHNYPVEDYTDNELAKLHIRHLAGGHADPIADEVVFRFEFPERPGALSEFLDSLSDQWSITLFHYRNHGADYGRVFVGLQIPKGEKAGITEFLDRLSYTYVEETHNPAYKQFLS